jgi:hypothetical protein
VLRLMSLNSFWLMAITPVLILLLAGFDLTDISKGLYSMQDRINNTWQSPFVHMGEIMPLGYITGCGLGCFNYPQLIFAPQLAKYYSPVDIFYLGTYLMFGPIMLVFMYCVIQTLRRTDDMLRLVMALVINVFTTTILTYGPASGLIMTAYVFGLVFARREGAERAASAVEAVWRDRVERLRAGRARTLGGAMGPATR